MAKFKKYLKIYNSEFFNGNNNMQGINLKLPDKNIVMSNRNDT